MKRYDLLILGSGSTAFAAAIRASELGFRTAMVERRSLGGTCVNRGCIPSKNLIAAATHWNAAKSHRFRGITIRPGSLDFGALVAQKDDVVKDMLRKKYESALSDRIDVIDGNASFIDPHTVQAHGTTISGDHVLIATGSRPRVPSIEGLSSVDYLTSDLLTVGEDQELRSLPRSLVIVGGGYIACELGQMFARFGVDVTLLSRTNRILDDDEPELGDGMRQVLERDGVTVLTETNATTVRRHADGVAIGTSSGREFGAEKIVIAVGREPNTDTLALDVAGVEVDQRGFVRVDEQLRTNVDGIWAAGDVRGGHMATPVGAHDGVIVADNALAHAEKSTDYRFVPRAVFTEPSLASVGITERDAASGAREYQTAVIPMEIVPRAAATHRTEGVLKMIAERGTRRILGVHMLGEAAHEAIHEAAIAMRFGATLDDLIDQVHVYPTMTEALKIGALAFDRDVSKLSCCAE